MILKIPNVLTSDELEYVTSRLAQAEFVDGKLTAGWHAKLVKNNQQLKHGTPEVQTLREFVEKAIRRNPLFQAAVRPKVLHSLLFSRYDVGMSYGSHTDNALMGDAAFLRSDVSFTLFLTAPSAYDGGELVLEGADDERAYKLETGAMIVYPSTTLHRVDPVTKGTRLVVVGWVQSLVRDVGEREILFDLDVVRRAIFAKEGKTPEFDLISKSVANLLRRWVD
ncbi:Fe2+-dependent dioxygenase [Oculatella sp. LEGE 06141]|nr:Fe2+-dependent dioxygenase [Oculatella sp. LEGE 06141]MBE9179078.1 Fe2+-dependent dioxygenase [Oculatella sp. LEGE 06141]